MRIDPHVKILDAAVVRRANMHGLDGIVYAPHFTPLTAIRQTAEEFSDSGFTVFPAREIFTGDWRSRKHVLALGLTEPIPDYITLEGALAELRRQGASVLVPHPTFGNVSLTASDIRRYRSSIDAIEIYNPKQLASHNQKANSLAGALDIPPFGSSYAHLRHTVGEVWTDIATHADTSAELGQALGNPSLEREVFHHPGWRHRVQCGLEKTHLVWENSVPKFRRLLRRNRIATDPRAAIYGGRFDEVAVY